jgi:acyl carrier protein
MSIAMAIKTFVLENYLFTSDASRLDDEASLMQQGIMDSTGVLEMILHLEQTYGIQVADDEMVPENLDSIANIARFVADKQSSRASAPP